MTRLLQLLCGLRGHDYTRTGAYWKPLCCTRCGHHTPGFGVVLPFTPKPSSARDTTRKPLVWGMDA